MVNAAWCRPNSKLPYDESGTFCVPMLKSNDMSAQEIIAELPKLNRRELETVDARLHELLQPGESRVAVTSWRSALLEVAGTAEGLPADLARNHDYYLHGVPR